MQTANNEETLRNIKEYKFQKKWNMNNMKIYFAIFYIIFGLFFGFLFLYNWFLYFIVGMICDKK